MTGRPQTILELLQVLTGWTPEEVAEAFGQDETRRPTDEAVEMVMERLEAMNDGNEDEN